MYLTHHRFFHDLKHTMILYDDATTLHKRGFLPCRPGFAENTHGKIILSCRWPGRPPPLFRRIPATTLVRGAYVAYRHQTVLGLTRHRGRPDFPYTWVLVDKNPPVENVTVWQRNAGNGFWFPLRFSVANTGIDHSTPDGSWPIFMRLKTGCMKGQTPTGIHYDDPGVHWINYFHGNIAVHGYKRAAYGFPQSAGCVELPLASARAIFRLVHDGTIVTVVGHWQTPPRTHSSFANLVRRLGNRS